MPVAWKYRHLHTYSSTRSYFFPIVSSFYSVIPTTEHIPNSCTASSHTWHTYEDRGFRRDSVKQKNFGDLEGPVRRIILSSEEYIIK